MLSSALTLSLIALVAAQQGPPSSPYAPNYTACPAELQVRPASSGLSQQETAWRAKRMPNVLSAIKDYLPRANITGLNVTSYLSQINADNAPISSFVISGGGATSGLGGLGVYQAFDGRYERAKNSGIGGLAQTFVYVSGLSGGGYLSTASLAAHNYSTVSDLVKNSKFGVDYNTGASGNATAYFDELFGNAIAKAELGFPVSVTDVFGQFFRVYLPESWQFRDWSDIATDPSHAFAQGTGPMPIVSAAEVIPGSSPEYMGIASPGLNDFNLTSFEITPFEFGSWRGGRVQAFMPTQYIGTTMSNGTVANSSVCVQGFDKVSFVQGTTAMAFNFYLISEFSNNTVAPFAKRDIVVPPYAEDSPIVGLVEGFAQGFNQSLNSTLWATYPNPFLNYNAEMNNVDELLLVDGSESGQTIAFWPTIQPERKVDFIVAVDGSGDANNPAYNWVNGTNAYNTYNVAKSGGIPFPQIPDATTFLNQNLSLYPTFFGCEDSNDGPVVLYLPNAPWTGYTNYTYTKPSFTNNQLDLVFDNWFNIASYGDKKLSTEQNWPTCVACAYIKKSMKRINMTVPDVCTQCFSKHCWNGTVSTAQAAPFNPSLILGGDDFATWNRTKFYA